MTDEELLNLYKDNPHMLSHLELAVVMTGNESAHRLLKRLCTLIKVEPFVKFLPGITPEITQATLWNA